MDLKQPRAFQQSEKLIKEKSNCFVLRNLQSRYIYESKTHFVYIYVCVCS